MLSFQHSGSLIMARLEKGRTNYRIDKRYRGIGEIKKSSGISDRAMYKRMLVMLDELYTMPRWDILQFSIAR